MAISDSYLQDTNNPSHFLFWILYISIPSIGQINQCVRWMRFGGWSKVMIEGCWHANMLSLLNKGIRSDLVYRKLVLSI